MRVDLQTGELMEFVISQEEEEFQTWIFRRSDASPKSRSDQAASAETEEVFFEKRECLPHASHIYKECTEAGSKTICQISRIIEHKTARQEVELRIYTEDDCESLTAILEEPKPNYFLPTINKVIMSDEEQFLGSAIVDGNLTWFIAPQIKSTTSKNNREAIYFRQEKL